MDRGHKSDAAAMGTPRHANLTTYLHSPSIARGKVGLGWIKVISFWQWLTPELVGHEIRILQDTLMLTSPRAIGVSCRKQSQLDGLLEFFHVWNCWNGTANIVCLRLAQFNLLQNSSDSLSHADTPRVGHFPRVHQCPSFPSRWSPYCE